MQPKFCSLPNDWAYSRTFHKRLIDCILLWRPIGQEQHSCIIRVPVGTYSETSREPRPCVSDAIRRALGGMHCRTKTSLLNPHRAAPDCSRLRRNVIGNPETRLSPPDPACPQSLAMDSRRKQTGKPKTNVRQWIDKGENDPGSIVLRSIGSMGPRLKTSSTVYSRNHSSF